MKKNSKLFLPLIILLIPAYSLCQVPVPSQPVPSQPAASLSAYPVIVAYTCFFLPIVSTSSKTTTWNFSSSFSIGVSTGINMLFSDKFGFSFDLGPLITTTGGTSRVSNFIFDPGPIFRLKKGYAIITRMAFETAGRFGESTVLSKVFSPAKKTSLFASLGIPIRFGNNLPASIGATLFFGVAFR
jgi:hypothetical protein